MPQQRGDLVVSKPERLQVQRLAILGLDQPQILEPSGVEDPVGDLVGELAVVAGGLTRSTRRIAVAVERVECAGGRFPALATAVPQGLVKGHVTSHARPVS